jgi:hypothetical protein
MLASPDLVLRWTERLVGMSVIISSLEWLARPAQFADPGMFSWSVFRLRTTWMASRRAAGLLRLIFGQRGVLSMHLLRLAGAVLLFFNLTDGIATGVLTATMAAFGMLFHTRTPYGHDGSDQMASIILIVLSIGYATSSPFTWALCFWFIALQATISYAAAGWAKVFNPGWRNGSLLARIWRTSTYGSAGIAAVTIKRGWPVSSAARFVLLWECTFPLVLVLPYPAIAVSLAAGFLFHVGSAAVMGLNTFVWSFAATYPALLYCSHALSLRLYRQ